MEHCVADGQPLNVLSDVIRLVVLGMIRYLDKNQADEAGCIMPAFKKVKIKYVNINNDGSIDIQDLENILSNE